MLFRLTIIICLASLPIGAGIAPHGRPVQAAALAESARGPEADAPERFPPAPRFDGGRRFYRGNYPPVPGQPDVVGRYLNLWRLGLLLGGFLLWVRTAHWIERDGRAVRVGTAFCSSLLLVAGLGGLAVALASPVFWAGFGIFTLCYAVPLALYLRERNRRVPSAARVFTPGHLWKAIVRRLARLGINVSTTDARSMAAGAPIAFLRQSSGGNGDEPPPSRRVENSRGYRAARELVYEALVRRSTDVHLEPREDEVAVRLRIDGVVCPTEPLDMGVGEAVVNVFKVLGNLDVTDKRRPQEGSFRAEVEDRQIDLRVTTQPTYQGEKLSLRLLDPAHSVGRLAELGLREPVLARLREIVHQPHGLLLSCGPTGAGKTTTLHAALRELDAERSNIITLEDPIEYRIENVAQIEINTSAGQTFAGVLRNILRQDPDALMVGEIRDRETARLALEAAGTGQMVFSTLHANDALTALGRLLDLGEETHLVAGALSAIVAQRLVRRLCPQCREASPPDPHLLDKLGLPADDVATVYRPPPAARKDCPTCGGFGYFGRTGVFELLEISEPVREMIRQKASISDIGTAAREEGMLSMREEALRLVKEGTTSPEELHRILR